MVDDSAISQLIPLETALSEELKSLLGQLLRGAARLVRAQAGLVAYEDPRARRMEVLAVHNLPEALLGVALTPDAKAAKPLAALGWTKQHLASPGAGLALNLSIPSPDPSSQRMILHLEWPAGTDAPAQAARSLSEVVRTVAAVLINREKARRFERLRKPETAQVRPGAEEDLDEPLPELLAGKIVRKALGLFPGSRVAVLLRSGRTADLVLLRGAFEGEPALKVSTLPRLLRRRAPARGTRVPDLRRLPIGPGGIPFHVLDTGRTYVAADLGRASRGSAFFRETRSGMAVPIPLGDSRLGVIVVESESPASFGVREASRLETLGRDCAVQVAKAIAYDESKRENPRDPILLVGTPRDLLEQAIAAAPVAATVLLQGESGAGKEMIARFIHRVGPRREKPFLTLNCAEVNPSLVESHLFGHMRGAFTGADRDVHGIFEQAGEGTVFIDEVHMLPLSLQSKLLRVLERGVVSPLGAGGAERLLHARVIVATNQPLERLVETGAFQKDLFYRLDVLRLRLRPLREYRGSILRIAGVLVREVAERNAKKAIPLTPAAERLLLQHSFPGNVRELRNALEHAVIRDHDGRLDVDDLPTTLVRGQRVHPDVRTPELRGFVGLGGPAEDPKKIVEALRDCHGNIVRAALELGVDRRQLYRLLDRHGIDPAQYRKVQAQA